LPPSRIWFENGSTVSANKSPQYCFYFWIQAKMRSYMQND